MLLETLSPTTSSAQIGAAQLPIACRILFTVQLAIVMLIIFTIYYVKRSISTLNNYHMINLRQMPPLERGYIDARRAGEIS
jgi:hypothetical protein